MKMFKVLVIKMLLKGIIIIYVAQLYQPVSSSENVILKKHRKPNIFK